MVRHTSNKYIVAYFSIIVVLSLELFQNKLIYFLSLQLPSTYYLSNDNGLEKMKRTLIHSIRKKEIVEISRTQNEERSVKHVPLPGHILVIKSRGKQSNLRNDCG